MDNNYTPPYGAPQSPENPQPGQAAGTAGAPVAGYSAPPPAGLYGGGLAGGAPTPNTPAPAATQPSLAPPTPPRKKRHGAHHILLGVLSAAMVVVLLLFSISFIRAGNALSSLFQAQNYSTNPPNNTFSVITVVGTIQNVGGDALGINEPSYHHAATVAHIKQLAQSNSNTGILLYMNTPGGGVLESDEVYLALMDYKKQTGRPVWAYMHATCASGGYYICAAADNIVANRNTTTGSIGVYIAMSDTSELYGKLGIETVLIRSGSNKGTGMSGLPITAAQRDVYQAMVDEYYEQFVEIVADGRGMDIDEVYPLADGRVFTGRQALESGLIDDLGDYDTILAQFMQKTGSNPFYPNFSQQTPLGRIIGSFTGSLPKGETETMLSMAEKYPVGVPMALYDPSA